MCYFSFPSSHNSIKLNNLWHQKSNFEKLKKEVERMRDVRADLLSTIEKAERRGEQIKRDVERQLKNVKEYIDNAMTIIEDFEQRVGNQCCKRLCLDLTTQYQLSKKATKQLKALSRLLKGRNFDRVSYGNLQRDIQFRYSKDYETSESRMTIFYDIYNALCNGDINMFGVYGMGGTDKTTPVKPVT